MTYLIRPYSAAGTLSLTDAVLVDESAHPQAIGALDARDYEVGRVGWAPQVWTVVEVPAAMLAPTLTGGAQTVTLAFPAAPASNNSTISAYGWELTTAADVNFEALVAQGQQPTRADVVTTPSTPGSYISRVRARNAAGWGAWSPASAAATVTAPGGAVNPVDANWAITHEPGAGGSARLWVDHLWWHAQPLTDLPVAIQYRVNGGTAREIVTAYPGAYAITTDVVVDASATYEVRLRLTSGAFTGWSTARAFTARRPGRLRLIGWADEGFERGEQGDLVPLGVGATGQAAIDNAAAAVIVALRLASLPSPGVPRGATVTQGAVSGVCVGALPGSGGARLYVRNVTGGAFATGTISADSRSFTVSATPVADPLEMIESRRVQSRLGMPFRVASGAMARIGVRGRASVEPAVSRRLATVARGTVSMDALHVATATLDLVADAPWNTFAFGGAGAAGMAQPTPGVLTYTKANNSLIGDVRFTWNAGGALLAGDIVEIDFSWVRDPGAHVSANLYTQAIQVGAAQAQAQGASQATASGNITQVLVVPTTATTPNGQVRLHIQCSANWYGSFTVNAIRRRGHSVELLTLAPLGVGTRLRHAVTQAGRVLPFARPYQTGRDATGRWFVIAENGRVIIEPPGDLARIVAPGTVIDYAGLRLAVVAQAGQLLPDAPTLTLTLPVRTWAAMTPTLAANWTPPTQSFGGVGMAQPSAALTTYTKTGAVSAGDVRFSWPAGGAVQAGDVLSVTWRRATTSPANVRLQAVQQGAVQGFTQLGALTGSGTVTETITIPSGATTPTGVVELRFAADATWSGTIEVISITKAGVQLALGAVNTALLRAVASDYHLGVYLDVESTVTPAPQVRIRERVGGVWGDWYADQPLSYAPQPKGATVTKDSRSRVQTERWRGVCVLLLPGREYQVQALYRGVLYEAAPVTTLDPAAIIAGAVRTVDLSADPVRTAELRLAKAGTTETVSPTAGAERVIAGHPTGWTVVRGLHHDTGNVAVRVEGERFILIDFDITDVECCGVRLLNRVPGETRDVRDIILADGRVATWGRNIRTNYDAANTATRPQSPFGDKQSWGAIHCALPVGSHASLTGLGFAESGADAYAPDRICVVGLDVGQPTLSSNSWDEQDHQGDSQGGNSTFNASFVSGYSHPLGPQAFMLTRGVRQLRIYGFSARGAADAAYNDTIGANVNFGAQATGLLGRVGSIRWAYARESLDDTIEDEGWIECGWLDRLALPFAPCRNHTDIAHGPIWRKDVLGLVAPIEAPVVVTRMLVPRFAFDRNEGGAIKFEVKGGTNYGWVDVLLAAQANVEVGHSFRHFWSPYGVSPNGRMRARSCLIETDPSDQGLPTSTLTTDITAPVFADNGLINYTSAGVRTRVTSGTAFTRNGGNALSAVPTFEDEWLTPLANVPLAAAIPGVTDRLGYPVRVGGQAMVSGGAFVS